MGKFLLFFHPDPPSGVLTETATPLPTPTPTPEREERKPLHPKDVECGFCESRITTTRGEVIKLSDRAKALERADRDLEHWKAECEKLRKENTELKNSRTPTAEAPRGWGG